VRVAELERQPERLVLRAVPDADDLQRLLEAGVTPSIMFATSVRLRPCSERCSGPIARALDEDLVPLARSIMSRWSVRSSCPFTRTSPS
jgi:hypothetical protein